jgi:hypothetical protein
MVVDLYFLISFVSLCRNNIATRSFYGIVQRANSDAPHPAYAGLRFLKWSLMNQNASSQNMFLSLIFNPYCFNLRKLFLEG